MSTSTLESTIVKELPNGRLHEVANTEISEGDIVAYNPDAVLPCYKEEIFSHTTGLFLVEKVKRGPAEDHEPETICVYGKNLITGQEKCLKRYIGKPIYKFVPIGRTDLDIDALVKGFTDIAEEMSVLINKADSLGGDGEPKESWNKHQALDQSRSEWLQSLFADNESDDLYDYVHDSILSEGEDMPAGYSATIFASIYCPVMRSRTSYAVVTTPFKRQYLVSVDTVTRVRPGTTYTSLAK